MNRIVNKSGKHFREKHEIRGDDTPQAQKNCPMPQRGEAPTPWGRPAAGVDEHEQHMLGFR